MTHKRELLEEFKIITIYLARSRCRKESIHYKKRLKKIDDELMKQGMNHDR